MKNKILLLAVAFATIGVAGIQQAEEKTSDGLVVKTTQVGDFSASKAGIIPPINPPIKP